MLYADATVLRPLRPGAVWRYNGKFSAFAGAVPVSYTNSATHTVDPSGGVLESETNSGNSGPSSETSRATGGSIVVPLSVDFAGKGVPEQLLLTELRSPVRQDDLWVLFEKRYTDTDIDLDRDGKPDTLDVALYSRVIGNEDVNLPGLPMVKALRLETVLAQRVRSSTDGRLSDVFRTKGQVWYAPGIGIVRATFESPTATSVETSEEVLVSWDGVDTGFGAMPLRPGPTSADLGGLRTIGDSNVFAFPNHVLLLASADTHADLTVAQRYDLRGNFLSATSVERRIGRSVDLVQLNDAVALIDTGGNSTDRQLTVFNSDGSLRAPQEGVLLKLGGTRTIPWIEQMRAVGAGDRFWMIWVRSYRDTDPLFSIRTEVVLQPFDVQGQPLAPERVLSIFDRQGQPQASGRVLSLREPVVPSLTARDGQVLLTWIGPAPQYDLMTAQLDASGQFVQRVAVAGLPSNRIGPTPHLLDQGGLLLWSWELGTGASQDFWAGLRLDSNFVAQRSGTELVAERFLDQRRFDFANTAALVAANGSRLVLADFDVNLLHQTPDTSSIAGRLVWLDIPPGAPLSRAVVNQVRGSFLTGAIAVYPDRALLFGSGGVTLVWLNAGR